MAEAKLDKLKYELKRLNINYTQNDFMNKKSVVIQSHRQKQIEKIHSSSQEKYSFKPNIAPSSKVQPKRRVPVQERALEPSYRLKQDKRQTDIDFETQKHDCTFRPDTHASRQSIKKSSRTKVYMKQVDQMRAKAAESIAAMSTN